MLFPCLVDDNENEPFEEEDTSSDEEQVKPVLAKPDNVREKKTRKVKKPSEKDNFFDSNSQKIVSESEPVVCNGSGDSFADLNLSRPMLKAIFEAGFVHPTQIQKACIPVALAGRDICACSATGTGKTAAFMLPIFERLLFRQKGRRSVTRVLVLVPTRELAIQVFQVSRKLSQFSQVDICLCAGFGNSLFQLSFILLSCYPFPRTADKNKRLEIRLTSMQQHDLHISRSFNSGIYSVLLQGAHKTKRFRQKMVSMDRKQKVMSVLSLIYFIWHFGTNWTTTLLSFLQWDTVEVLTIVDLAYIQAFGSLCNAIGSLAIGQITDSTGPKTMFLFSAIFTALYYVGLSFGRCWYSFFFLQILRVGYQLDSTAEMYLATVTTERERTSALMFLTIPQALSMFVAPIVASKVAVYTTLRISQAINGLVLAALLIPVLLFFLPTTHSIPRLASARLRPQDYWPMITRNAGLREGLILRALLIVAYVCYEIIARNFLLRAYMQGTSDSAEVLIVMGCSLLATQFLVLPFLQKHYSPKTLLQLAILTLVLSYGAVTFTTSLMQFLMVTAVQTGAYAIAYAESSTQITCAVEMTDLGKATGLASMVQWTSHFLVPIYTSHLVNHWHYTYAFYTSSVIMFITLGYITIFAKQTNARLRTLLPNLILT